MKKRSWKLKLGLFLMILSVVFFISLLVIPLLSIDGKIKITLSAASFISGEILFWSGGLLVGKELFNKYKSYFNPKVWFRR